MNGRLACGPDLSLVWLKVGFGATCDGPLPRLRDRFPWDEATFADASGSDGLAPKAVMSSVGHSAVGRCVFKRLPLATRPGSRSSPE